MKDLSHILSTTNKTDRADQKSPKKIGIVQLVRSRIEVIEILKTKSAFSFKHQGEALYIINSVGIAYHQNEVLYIIIAKAMDKKRLNLAYNIMQTRFNWGR